MTVATEMVGKTFGRLQVAEGVPPATGRTRIKLRWKCMCACGNAVLVDGDRLRSGRTRSCGCFRRDRQREANTAHGMHSAPEYQVWKAMRQRCANKNADNYPHYGGRGIKVCDRWRDFAAFLSDMGPRTSPAHQIERRDNNGDYEPSNCCWATRVEQAANTRQAILLDVNGVTMTVGAACRATGLGRKVVIKQYGRASQLEGEGS